jgi:hypothetical protein
MEHLRFEKHDRVKDGDRFVFRFPIVHSLYWVTNDNAHTMPIECKNPEKTREILTAWLQVSQKAFVKPPSIDQCVYNCSVQHSPNESRIHEMSEDDKKSQWIYRWEPVSVAVKAPNFIVNWAPVEKELDTRIQDVFEEQDQIQAESLPEVQNPTRTYVVNTRDAVAYPEELHDIPLSGVAPFRLSLEADKKKEKLRKQVREARMKAKLARYRVERLCQRYEEKYGDYPSEDEEEAETEYETEYVDANEYP